MLGWLWRIIFGSFNGCEHKWKIIQEVKKLGQRTDIYDDPIGEKFILGTKYTLQCEKCGDIKFKNNY